MQKYFATLILLHVILLGYGQDLDYNLTPIEARPLSQETLISAQTMMDLNSRYPVSWINRYFSTEITAVNDGVFITATGENDTLSDEQLKILRAADLNSDVNVVVKYNPKNSLKDENDQRTIDFSFTIIPVVQAEFTGGYSQFEAFIRNNIIQQWPEQQQNKEQKFQLARVSFVVAEDGEITQVQIFESSDDVPIDSLVKEAICDMPKWQPAEDYKGNKVQQKFQFSIGTKGNCLLSYSNAF